MTNRQKSWLNITLCIFIPIIISLVGKLFFNAPFEVVLTICYSILLFFLMPTDSLFGDTLDYNAKSLNPTFRPQKKIISSSLKIEIIRFILVLLALLLNLIIWYINAQ